jgi:hypothetical protein
MLREVQCFGAGHQQLRLLVCLSSSISFEFDFSIY